MSVIINNNVSHTTKNTSKNCMSDLLICRCHGVTKTILLDAIQAGATSLHDIKEKTKASTGCGGCERVIQKLIMLGDV